MKSALPFAICFVWSLMSSSALACDTAATATLESTCVVMERDGTPGVWFDLKTTEQFARMKLELPELKVQLGLQERIAEAQALQLNNFREAFESQQLALDISKTAHAQAVSMAAIAAEDARAARAEKSAWYRNPTVWAVTGAILGGLLIWQVK